MGLVTLPNLYCSDFDVQDYLSTEGVELRLDDHQQATGQPIQVTVAASQGATSVTINALEAPLLNGAVLNFDGAGMASVVQVVLTATAQIGDNTISVLPLSGPLNAGSYATDNGVNIATNARLLKARQYATARVKMYCAGRYDDSQLAQSWSVNRWTMVLAAQWICKRRAQGVPQSVADDVQETMDELKAVQAARLDIEDINTRTSSWPAFSNTTVDLTYDVHRVRVEQSLSEPTPTQYSQYVDWYDSQTYDY